jgi:hypothetical protein
MNTRLQQNLSQDQTGSILHGNGARALRPWLSAALLILSLAAPGVATQADAQAHPANHARSAVGTLKVWVPASVIGDDYWIYANGKIVSAPPRSPALPKGGIVPVRQDKSSSHPRGWGLWSKNGFILGMHHEEYDDLIAYIGSASLDPEHIFRETDLPLRPGHYTVELAIHSPVSLPSHPANTYDESPFPFLFTRRYEVDIRAGEATRLYPGIPDNWGAPQFAAPAMAPRWVSSSQSAPPSVDALQILVNEYMNDRMVKLLRGVDAAILSQPKGAVVLDLSEEEGGPREFDKYQVRIFADAIAARRKVPQHGDIAELRRHYPQWSPSYDAYDKVITVIDNDLESLRKLGAPLHPDQPDEDDSTQ